MKYAILVAAFMTLTATTTSSATPPADLMAEVRRGWYCGACRCQFDGLDYSAAVDLRFEKQERKNQCQKQK